MYVYICMVLQLFLLEEVRERKYDGFARKIQKAWRRILCRDENCSQMYIVYVIHYNLHTCVYVSQSIKIYVACVYIISL